MQRIKRIAKDVATTLVPWGQTVKALRKDYGYGRDYLKYGALFGTVPADLAKSYICYVTVAMPAANREYFWLAIILGYLVATGIGEAGRKFLAQPLLGAYLASPRNQYVETGVQRS